MQAPIAPNPAAPTLCDAFQAAVAARGGATALKSFGATRLLTWAEYGRRVDRIAGGLSALGVGAGDTVAVMLRNRPEAFLTDVAALHLGATPFSIDTTSAPEQIGAILRNAASRVVVTELAFLPPLLAAHATAVEEVIVVDGVVDGMRTLNELEALGAGFDAAVAGGDVPDSAIAALIYTFDTTDLPKGVELTHRNLIAGLRSAEKVFGGVGPEARLVSYLPLAHIADRWFGHYLSLFYGASLTTVADHTTVIQALADIRPTHWLAVPRTWEKLMSALRTQGITDPKQLDDGARAAVRATLGLAEAHALVACAAPMALEALEYFSALGIEVLEGWAIAETAGVGTINRRGAVRHGTVGTAVPGVELRLAGDGELLVRGPSVMAGYRGEPERTAEVLGDDGWLRTGHVAEISGDGYVTIVDRGHSEQIEAMYAVHA